MGVAMAVSICVLRTHMLDGPTRALLSQLQRDLGADRVFVMFDETRGAWPQAGAPAGLTACRWDDGRDLHARAMLFDDGECMRVNAMHDRGYGHAKYSWSFWHPETSFVMMHDFALARVAGGFEYMWVVEYDVRCHGSFAAALGRCDQVAADFMAKGGDDRFELRSGRTDPWCWWGSLEGELAITPIERQLGAFFPVTRVSHAMVEALRAQFGRSTGFCELYFSTLCSVAGLLAVAMPREVFGHFVYQPSMSNEEYERVKRITLADDLLHHPVK